MLDGALAKVSEARRGVIFARQLLMSAAVALAVMSASELHAHLALQSSSPGAGDRLLAVPDAIRLTFTEPIELALSTIVLTGPDGRSITLGRLEAGEGREIVFAAVADRLIAGGYTVSWQAVGRDGHPVRGEFTFVIDEDAEGLVPPAEETPPDSLLAISADPTPPPTLGSFSSQSPLYAAVRWLGYVGILGTIGALGFAVLLASPTVQRAPAISEAFRAQAARGAAGIGILALLLLAVTLPLRLQAQAHAIFGGGITGERFSLLLTSMWGVAWLVQLAGAVAALGGLLIAWRGRKAGWAVTAAGVIALIAAPAMSGHAAAAEPSALLAIVADAVHILAAGTWLGTLLVILLVGVPLARRQAAGKPGQILSGMVQGFSPIALAAAGVLLATGLIAATLQLTALTDLWRTGYGRVLLAKFFLVVLVLGFGAYNWRRMRPLIGEPGSDARFLRSGSAELVAAALVIGLTAVLVAVPPPAHLPNGPGEPVDTMIEP